jgi:serine/threonine protein kinase
MNSAEREQQFGYVAKLNSDYLVKYYDKFIFNNDLYVVMQYFKNGNLDNFIKRYQEGNRRIQEHVYFYFIWNVCFFKACRKNSVIITVRSLCTSL